MSIKLISYLKNTDTSAAVINQNMLDIGIGGDGLGGYGFDVTFQIHAEVANAAILGRGSAQKRLSYESGQVVFHGGTGADTPMGAVALDTDCRIQLTYDQQSGNYDLYKNGILFLSGLILTDWNSTNDFMAFCYALGQPAQNASIKKLKIYDPSGDLVYDGSPAYDTDNNLYGLYDEVSDSFMGASAFSGVGSLTLKLYYEGSGTGTLLTPGLQFGVNTVDFGETISLNVRAADGYAVIGWFEVRDNQKQSITASNPIVITPYDDATYICRILPDIRSSISYDFDIYAGPNQILDENDTLIRSGWTWDIPYITDDDYKNGTFENASYLLPSYYGYYETYESDADARDFLLSFLEKIPDALDPNRYGDDIFSNNAFSIYETGADYTYIKLVSQKMPNTYISIRCARDNNFGRANIYIAGAHVDFDAATGTASWPMFLAHGRDPGTPGYVWHNIFTVITTGLISGEYGSTTKFHLINKFGNAYPYKIGPICHQVTRALVEYDGLANFFRAIETYNQITPAPDPLTPETDIKDLESDTIDADFINNYLPYGTYGFYTLFTPTQAELQSFITELNDSTFQASIKSLWNDSLLHMQDLIVDAHVIPGIPSIEASAKTVKVGFVNTTVSMHYTEDSYIEIDMGSIDIPRAWNNFMDFSPYTSIMIYLPFIGERSLDTDKVIGKTIAIKYYVDVLSGDLMAMLSVDGSVIYQFSGNGAYKIPLSDTDMSNIAMAPLKILGAAGFAAATGGAGVITAGGTMAGAAKIAGASAADAAIKSAAESKPSFSAIDGVSGNAGYMGISSPYVAITRAYPAIPENFASYEGLASMKTLSLGNISGYTEIESIHLDGINATAEELTEIESILKGGVIF